MAKQVREEWNVRLDEFRQSQVILEDSKVSIDHGDPVKLKKFKNKGNILEQQYEIPLDTHTAVLYIGSRNEGRPVLTLNGVDLVTGLPYEPIRIPGWTWAFYALYIVNFIILLGGAVGGAVWTMCAYLTARIATNRNRTTGVNVLMCVGLYVGASVAGLILAVALSLILTPLVGRS